MPTRTPVLMNVNAKIRNKILANWTQVYIKYKDTYKNMKYTYIYNIKKNASWTSGLYWKNIRLFQFSSVQFIRSVMSDSLWPQELQHTRPPFPLPTPGVHPNSSPSSRWCHPAISSSVVPFSSWPQSLPASGSFPTNQLFAWGGPSIGVSALASVLPKNT